MTAVPILSLVGVCKAFARGRRLEVRVLVDVSLELEAGEVVAVLAQRASGKSTLLRLAGTLERPDAGRVIFDGLDVWTLSDARRWGLLSGEIGFVSTQPPELDVPLVTMVALPMFGVVGRAQAYVRAHRTLDRVGVSQCAQQHWGSLADWERALAAVAIGAARSPKLLLVDDLTAMLGLGETEEIVGLLGAFAREDGMAVLMGVSDASATRTADRIATLAGGELLVPEDAPPSPATLIDFPSHRKPARGLDPRG